MGGMTVENLIKEYRELLKSVIRAKEQADDEDQEVLGRMESVDDYGRQSGNRRGIERRAIYQRERSIDPIHFQRYARHPLYQNDEHTSSDWDMWRVEDTLSTLNQLEREVYMMKVGQVFSMEQVAGFLGITKGFVQTMLKRAENKMLKQKETILFLVG